MKHLFSWLTGAVCYALLTVLLSAYDNTEMHPALNEPMLEAFLDRFVNGPARPADLTGYDFAFDGFLSFEGPAVTSWGYFASTIGEDMRAKTVREWLLHGGYSADEPQVPAALRHFYDPLGIDDGKTWLTDRGTNWEWMINNNALNPSIDAKEWALRHEENPWTWEKGKEWMRKALAEPDDTRRDQHLARAWRCLGEALHLIADMGCSAHVRNDSHAAPRITDRPPYPAPKLGAMTYDAKTTTFNKSFPGGQVVRMCKDEGFFLERTYPYIDEACVESQSSVLITNIIEAGANLIRLFIPRLDVRMISAGTDGVAHGSIVLKSNAEYSDRSAVAGRIYILIDGSEIGHGDIQSDGSFTVDGLTLKKGDKVVAEFRFGAMYIRSEPVTVDDSDRLDELLKAQCVLVHFSAEQMVFTDKTRNTSFRYGYSDVKSEFGFHPMTWNGRDFSLVHTSTVNDNTQSTSISGSVSADGRTVLSVRVQYSSSSRSGDRETDELEFRNLPSTTAPPPAPDRRTGLRYLRSRRGTTFRHQEVQLSRNISRQFPRIRLSAHELERGEAAHRSEILPMTVSMYQKLVC